MHPPNCQQWLQDRCRTVRKGRGRRVHRRYDDRDMRTAVQGADRIALPLVTKPALLVLAAVLLSVSMSTQAEPLAEETLTIEGDSYRPTCVTSQWQALQRDIASAAAGVGVDRLVSLVHIALCDNGPKADEALRQASVVPMRLSSTSTGGDKTFIEQLPRARIHAFSGAAWNASATASDEGVDVAFYRNAACIETLSLGPRGHAWRVVAMAQACD